MYDLASFKLAFDAQLRLFLAKKKKQSYARTRDKMARTVIDKAIHLALHDGKRIRPYLAYLGYCAAGGKNPRSILDALVGIELFHVFALIHDDVMDKADMRRGTPTIHASVARALGNDPRAVHTGYAQAILAGDLLYTWSHEALLADLPPVVHKRVQPRFYAMIEEVIIGQMLDVDMGVRKRVAMSAIKEKELLKTARYTFVHPLLIGMALHCTSEVLEHSFEQFGTHAGRAFQMQDDLLDIMGDSAKTGKPMLGDVAEGKHTFFTHYISEKGTPKEKRLLVRYFGKRITQPDRRTLQAVFASSGSIDAGKRVMQKEIRAAKNVIDGAPITSIYKKAFMILADMICARAS